MQTGEIIKVSNQNDKHSDKHPIPYYSAVEIKGFTFSRYSEGVMP